MMSSQKTILKLQGISKRYGGLQALDNVSLDIRSHEVHALVGENGAGKSTLINILGGIVPRDSGTVVFHDKEVVFNKAQEAIDAGIAIIHQELSMLPTLNIIENIYMGRMVSSFGKINWKIMEEMAREQMARIGLEIDPYSLVQDLTASQRQMVEIAKALSIDASLIVMDEPNSSLSEVDSEKLFKVIESLKKDGMSILYVSHKMEEVLRISDRITAFRDGTYVDTVNTEESSVNDVIQMMVGRDLEREHIHRTVSEETILEVSELCSSRFQDISFKLKKGEILGFSGLVGSGRSEVARAIFGADSFDSGSVLLENEDVRFQSPQQAIRSGVAMVAEDRKVQSLFLKQPIHFNMSMAQLPGLARKQVVKNDRVNALVQKYKEKLNIKMDDSDDPVNSLSGGNQQKTILGRWLATSPKVLILDEPTHGVDIMAKAEIYKLIHELANEGVSIILISSEMPEIIAMSDRVIVMHEGRITGDLKEDEITEEKIMTCAAGMLSYV
ncbi:MAG: sugar ABC transporter ATP-binding protein [Spirochaetales bacterium]|nr:sugar ABC transporter ATP-binding protein [Spirochaetales bacterium]